MQERESYLQHTRWRSPDEARDFRRPDHLHIN